MPWQLKAKKDVVICDNPRGVDTQTLIRGSPNGATRLIYQSFHVESASIDMQKQTQGIETSQYLEEKKSTEISLVVASEREIAQHDLACGLVERSGKSGHSG